MPPLPKRKFSKGRTRRKRAGHWHLKKPNIQLCPFCKQPKVPHRACANCGKYGTK